MSSLNIDRNQAERFIEALTGSRDTPVSFRTFTDDREAKARGQADALAAGREWRDPLAKKLHGPLAEVWPQLADLNGKGAGVYLVVNAGEGNGPAHTDGEVATVRALFVDDDAGSLADPAGLAPPPSGVVRTKAGCHVYWLVADFPLAMFREAQERLIHALGTDRVIKNPSRVMRVPGFIHRKDPAAAVRIELEVCEPGRRYDGQEVLAHYPPVARAEARPTPVTTATSGTDHERNFAKWCARKGTADGERNANLWRILNEGRGRVLAGALDDAVVEREMLAYAERSGVGRTTRQVRDMASLPYRKAYEANMPARQRPTADGAMPTNRVGVLAAAPVAPAVRGEAAEGDRPRAATPADDEDQAPSPPARFRLWTDGELAERPAPRWLVEDVITSGGASLVYGPSGHGKTFVVMGLAACIAAGLDWNGHAVEAGLVVYVSGEGFIGIPQRLRAWKLRRGVDGELARIRFVLEPVNLMQPEDVGPFVAALASLPERPALIVFDTLARCIVGGDENSAKDMGMAIAGVDYIRQATGAAVLLVHHSGKGAGDVERGSSAIKAAMDTAILVKADDERITVSCEKQKDGVAFRSAVWKLAPVEGTDSVAAVPLVAEGENRQEPPAERLTRNQRNVLEAVRNCSVEHAGVSLANLVRLTGLPKSTVRSACGRLLDRGYLLYDGVLEVYHVGRANRAKPCEPYDFAHAETEGGGRANCAKNPKGSHASHDPTDSRPKESSKMPLPIERGEL